MTTPRPIRAVLITGAAGAIGRALRAGLAGRYAPLRLSDRAPLGEPGPGEELAPAQLGDLPALELAMQGIDAVVHLGGTPIEAPWEEILQNNIIGCFNVFEAARRAGVRRVIFASSNHVIGFYERSEPVGPDAPPRPDTRYGVSKVFGEALGRLYADKHGLEVVNLRIGSFRPAPTDLRMLGTWISPHDMVALVDRCLAAERVGWEVAYGVSGNPRCLWHDDFSKRIGYRPADSAETHLAALLERMAPEDEPPLERRFHGGSFCALEYDADPEELA